MPGVSETAAAVIVAEIGDDRAVFPSAPAISCPGRACARAWTKAREAPLDTHSSGGAVAQDDPRADRLARSSEEAQRLPGAGSPAQESAGPEEGDCRRAPPRCSRRALHVGDGVGFRDLGDQHFVQRDKARLTNRLLQRLRDLGVQVEVKAA